MKKLGLLFVALLVVACSGETAGTITPTEPASEPEQVQVTEEVAEPTEEMAESDAPQETVESTMEAQTQTEALPITELDHAELLNTILFANSGGADTLRQIRESGDTQFVAGLIDTLRYRRDLGEDIGFTLNTLTGESLFPDWGAWVEWAGNHPEIESFADYSAWKANLLAQIDPNFLRFIHADLKVDPDSRVEEIVWGGVRVDGIPALDNPTMIDPEDADYLVAEERVFGVSINGDTRAYPARFLDWHEMFNDIVGGEPVSLAY